MIPPKFLYPYTKVLSLVSAVLIAVYIVAGGIISFYMISPDITSEASFTYQDLRNPALELALSDENAIMFSRVTREQFDADKTFYYTILQEDYQKQLGIRLARTIVFGLLWTAVFIVHFRLFRVLKSLYGK